MKQVYLCKIGTLGWFQCYQDARQDAGDCRTTWFPRDPDEILRMLVQMPEFPQDSSIVPKVMIPNILHQILRMLGKMLTIIEWNDHEQDVRDWIFIQTLRICKYAPKGFRDSRDARQDARDSRPDAGDRDRIKIAGGSNGVHCAPDVLTRKKKPKQFNPTSTDSRCSARCSARCSGGFRLLLFFQHRPRYVSVGFFIDFARVDTCTKKISL